MAVREGWSERFKGLDDDLWFRRKVIFFIEKVLAEYQLWVKQHINFRGLLNVKNIFVEVQKEYHLTHSWEDEGFITFLSVLVQKWTK